MVRAPVRMRCRTRSGLEGLDLRELAKRRLQRLQEPTPEDALKEIEEARQRGDLLLILGGVRILLAGLAKPAPQP